MVHPNNLELECPARPLSPNSSDLVGASKAVRRDEQNVFGDILELIDAKKWLDGVVDQSQKKKSSPRGSVPAVNDLKGSTISAADSFDSEERRKSNNASLRLD